jgi:hypothetical protein
VLVVTNDPAAKNLRLKVSARVEMVLAIKPARIVIPKFISKDGSTDPLYAQFTGTKSNSVNIVSVKSANKLLNIEINKDGFDGDTTRQIKIKVLPGMAVGRFREAVVFKTDSESVASLKLYVVGEVLGNITVSPQHLSLGMITPDTTISKTIKLQSTRDANTFNITDVSTTSEWLVTELKTITPGKEYRVRVSLAKKIQPTVIRGQIVIKTDDEAQRTITVNVFGRAAPVLRRTRQEERDTGKELPPM